MSASIRNLAAKSLASPLFKQRIIKSKKGNGSYNRKKNNKMDDN